ncbi:hypothetical protein CHS0354_023814 [Potamilus streckersoni]|uniref:Uncharacterized protein n=1 Tax=Potamilus streckersoni TaxID=2493646 RepID=A0AAE0RZA7_9BIVA|nr:hypothetical protein CHS0354_023814 [Potamilus streckersoni]
MEMLALGRKDLFKDLWIEDKWNWTRKYPVIRISFTQVSYQESGLKKGLINALINIFKSFQLVPNQTENLKELFNQLLNEVHAKHGKIVLLIDEYDKPIIDFLEEKHIETATENQAIMKNFYSCLKDNGHFIHTLLITGISKFPRVSIFSELNHLDDLTLDPNYVNLLGYTQEELEKYFDEHLDFYLTKHNKETKQSLLDKIRLWYNGFSWDGENRVYNPFSILNFFQKNTFANYWFVSGTPTFLLRLMFEKKNYEFENVSFNVNSNNIYDIHKLELIPILFQTGYLTIVEAKDNPFSEMKDYVLNYPNKEVRDSFYDFIINSICFTDGADKKFIERISRGFIENNLDEVEEVIDEMFKDVPHDFYVKQEVVLHCLLHIVFTYVGLQIQSEVHTQKGRLDAIVETKSHVYIFEFKINKTVNEAIKQIRQKEYGLKYAKTKKQLIGIDGGSLIDNQVIACWEKATRPSNPTKVGFTFVNWYKEATFVTVFDFNTPITANMTLYAKWTAVVANQFVVNFNTDGGSAIANQTVANGGKAARPSNPTKVGFTFVDWYKEATLTTVYDFNTPITANMTLYAKWTAVVANQFVVNFNTDGGSAIANQTVANGGKAARPSNPTKVGFTFVDWYKEATFVTVFDFNTPITANMTLYAKWTAVVANQFVVNFNTDGGSAIANQTVANGGKATRPSNPTKVGFTFVDWYKEATLTTVYDFNTPITANMTLYAKWTAVVANQFVVNFNTDGGSAIANQTVANGGKAARPSNPTKVGFTFVDWYKEATLTTVYDFNTPITANMTLYAKWNQSQPTITEFSPTMAVVGDNVTIIGTNFSSTRTNNTVKFNNVAAHVVSATTTQIVATVPANAITGKITVTVLFLSTISAKDIIITCGKLTYDGKTYYGVQIGTQCWLNENLNSDDNTKGTSLCYDRDANNCSAYGRLYNWEAAKDMDSKIVGWHLPSDNEWTILSNYLGGNDLAGRKLINGGTSGFNALLAGSYYYNFYGLDSFGAFWSSTADGTNGAWTRYIDHHPILFYRFVRQNVAVLSMTTVRLLKD